MAEDTDVARETIVCSREDECSICFGNDVDVIS